MATQIVYGGGDYDTADFYSKASGTATADANPDPNKANLRQRPLLTSDEIVNPEDGVCHIFSRFVQNNYAAQVILKAQLTRLYEREDWKERLARSVHDAPFKLERGISIDLSDEVLSCPPEPVPMVAKLPLSAAHTVSSPALAQSDFDLQAAARMQAVRTQSEAGKSLLADAGIAAVSVAQYRARFGQKRHATTGNNLKSAPEPHSVVL